MYTISGQDARTTTRILLLTSVPDNNGNCCIYREQDAPTTKLLEFKN
jgi:hypothetical protein